MARPLKKTETTEILTKEIAVTQSLMISVHQRDDGCWCAELIDFPLETVATSREAAEAGIAQYIKFLWGIFLGCANSTHPTQLGQETP